MNNIRTSGEGNGEAEEKKRKKEKKKRERLTWSSLIKQSGTG